MGSCGAGPSYFVFSKRIFPRQVGNRRSNTTYPIGRVVRSLSAVREKMMARSLLQPTEAFLTESAMPHSVIGRAALRDPGLRSARRSGRQPGREITVRAEHFMNNWNPSRLVGLGVSPG